MEFFDHYHAPRRVTGSTHAPRPAVALTVDPALAPSLRGRYTRHGAGEVFGVGHCTRLGHACNPETVDTNQPAVV